MYSVRGINVATAATADHAIWALWNPHATQRIKLINFAMFARGAAPAAGFNTRLRRISARGTAGSTVTPGISSHSTRGAAPVSGALLDLAAYSVQPTLDGIDLAPGFVFAAVQASGLVYPVPGGLEIGPGAGIACIQVQAAASVTFEIGATWLEDWL